MICVFGPLLGHLKKNKFCVFMVKIQQPCPIYQNKTMVDDLRHQPSLSSAQFCLSSVQFCVKLKVLHYSLCLSQEAHSEAYLALFTGACKYWLQALPGLYRMRPPNARQGALVEQASGLAACLLASFKLLLFIIKAKPIVCLVFGLGSPPISMSRCCRRFSFISIHF